MPKIVKRIPTEQRLLAEEEMQNRLRSGDISLGAAIREMRQEWLGLHLDRYAKICGVSKNTLSAIERDEDSASIATVNKVLKPIGYRLTITSAKLI